MSRTSTRALGALTPMFALAVTGALAYGCLLRDGRYQHQGRDDRSGARSDALSTGAKTFPEADPEVRPAFARVMEHRKAVC